MCFWVGMIFFQACPAKIRPRPSKSLAPSSRAYEMNRRSLFRELSCCDRVVRKFLMDEKHFFCRQNDEKWAHFLGSILKEIIKDGGAKNVLNFDENGMLNFDENGMPNLR